MLSASSPHLVRRVLDQLAAAEGREPNPQWQCDYRIAWITVLYADRGYLQPHVAATYGVLGLHPAKVWPAIVERRKSLLGDLYREFWAEALPPKKPPQSVTIERRSKWAA